MLIGRFAAPTLLLLCLGGCSHDPRQKYSQFLESGKRKLQAQDYTRAILELRNAISAMPDDPEAHYQIALAYLPTNRVDEGVAELRKAIELKPDHVGAQIKLSEIMVLSRETKWVEDAETRLRKVLMADPNQAQALFVLAATQMQLGKAQEAERYLKEVLLRAPQELNATLSLAQVKISQKDWKGAEALLRETMERAPNSADANVVLAALYLSTNRTDEADRQLQRAVQIDPNHAGALFRLAAVRLQAGNKTEAEQIYRRISGLPSTRWPGAYGEFLILQGKTDAAISEFQRLAKAAPDDRLARSRLVAALVAGNRTPEAETLLGAALRKNKNDLDALLQRCEIYVQTARISLAEEDINHALAQFPDSATVHYLLAQVSGSHGRNRLRLQELAEALRLAPSWLTARAEYANALVESHAARNAASVLDEAPELQKNDLIWITAKNWAYIGMSDYTSAKKGIEAALRLGKTPDLLLQDGLACLATKDFTNARSRLEEALHMNPGDTRAMAALARNYSLQNQKSAGEEAVRRLAAAKPDSVPVQMFYAKLLSDDGKVDEAKVVLTKLQDLDRRDAGPALMLAKLSLQQGKLPEAENAIASALAADPSSSAAQMLHGMVQEASKHLDEAAVQYRKVIADDPNQIVALNNLACILARDPAQLDVALGLAQRAKQLAPDSVAVQDSLGWIYYRKGLYQLAEQELKAAVSAGAPPIVRFHLGMTYLKTGRNAEGKRMVLEASRDDPNLALQQDR